MASEKSSRLPSDPERGGVNAPMHSADAVPTAGRRPYQDSKCWDSHPHDPYSLVRDGRHFLPLGVYARSILHRRDADVGRLMLSMAAHRTTCMAWDLLPDAPDSPSAAAPAAPAILWPWAVDRLTGQSDFERFHSAYFARLEVLLHAVTESDVAILLRTPGPAQAEQLRIPRDAWRKFLAEVATSAAEYKQVGFAIDIDGYAVTAAELSRHLPEFCGTAFLSARSPALDTPVLEQASNLTPRPRLLWIHNPSLLTPQYGAPSWEGPILNTYSRNSDPVPPSAATPADSEGAAQAPSLAAAWSSLTQGAGVMWAYAGVGIFQSPLRDLAVFQGFTRIIEELEIEWTGLTAARHLFQVPLVEQPNAAQSRGGAILAYFPQLSGEGLRVWLKPTAHRLGWYRPLEPGIVYQASGIVGYPGAPAGIPVPQALVGQPAVLTLIPEN